MCGLAGWVGHLDVDDATIDDVLAALHHRGPDGASSRRFPQGGLLHARLRIIDLSPLGDQPMANEDESVWVVFNGEIYNHHELRRDLERRGHRLRGRSDTEVIPHLWEEHGRDMLPLLRGMFAIAVLDLRTRTLLLARDRFGIKPLVYSHGPSWLAFSSEIRALRRFPGISAQPDRQAIADYAALFYVPAPRTAFERISSLEPGCAIEARHGANGIELDGFRYHRWSHEVDEHITPADAEERADALVDAAVRRQLESDVPLGAMLSGGIDSSLVSASAQRALDGRLLTFNVRPSDEAFDETPAAVAVARHLRTTHETVDLEEGAADWESVTDLLRRLGQPLADPSLFAVSAVSEAMRRHVTVALSGDGGDELFGGYDLYLRLGTLARLRRFPAFAWRIGAAVAGPAARLGLVRPSVPRRLGDLAGADDTAIVQTLYSWLQRAEHRDLLADPDSIDPPRRLFERTWDVAGVRENGLERLCAHAVEVNVRMVLANSFLFKVDAASMRHSLEVRVPLLDEDLAAFGLSLPYGLRVANGRGKRVLRQVARRRIPADVAARPKQGFALPLDRWADHAFRSAARETLLDPAGPVSDHFRVSAYAPWLDAFVDGKPVAGLTRVGLYHRVMMLVALDTSLRG